MQNTTSSSVYHICSWHARTKKNGITKNNILLKKKKKTRKKLAEGI